MDRRIRIPRDKGDLVDRLTRSDTYPNGPFRQKSDVITFAAAYGFRKGARRPFSESLEPIRLEVFERRGHDLAIYLLAFAETKDPTILAPSDEALARRVTIFEEYANGGLEFLRRELQGLDDPLPRLLLLIAAERAIGEPEPPEEFDLSRFLT